MCLDISFQKWLSAPLNGLLEFKTCYHLYKLSSFIDNMFSYKSVSQRTVLLSRDGIENRTVNTVVLKKTKTFPTLKNILMI